MSTNGLMKDLVSEYIFLNGTLVKMDCKSIWFFNQYLIIFKRLMIRKF